MIKNIALVAHDARKTELVDWVRFNAGSLESCALYCTVQERPDDSLRRLWLKSLGTGCRKCTVC